MIRNAGGAITEDAIRSLVISQRLLGTREVILIHHSDCGMLTFADDALKRDIQAETGIRPAFAFEPFSDLDEDVRQSLARVRANPFIPHRDEVRGFVYDVRTGRLREVKWRGKRRRRGSPAQPLPPSRSHHIAPAASAGPTRIGYGRVHRATPASRTTAHPA